jgi:hypothetical protein
MEFYSADIEMLVSRRNTLYFSFVPDIIFPQNERGVLPILKYDSLSWQTAIFSNGLCFGIIDLCIDAHISRPPDFGPKQQHNDQIITSRREMNVYQGVEWTTAIGRHGLDENVII